MTEPEQWAVTEADIEGTPDWAFSLASTIVLGNYGCGHAAVLIQRTFEDRERKLREAGIALLAHIGPRDSRVYRTDPAVRRFEAALATRQDAPVTENSDDQ